MQRIRILGLAFIAVLALSAIASTTAHAENLEFLPAAATTFSGKGGAKTLETVAKNKIECSSDTESGTIKPPASGSATIVVKGCKSSGFACTGEKAGEPSGQVTAEGTFDLGRLLTKGAKHYGLILLLTPVHYECFIVLLLEKGNICILIAPGNKDTKNFTLTARMSAGHQEYTQWFDGAGTIHNCKLESAKNGGAFEESGEESSSNTMETAALAEIMG